MARFVLRKFLHLIPVLLIVSFAASLMLHLAPGDPAFALLGEQATPEAIQQVHTELGLDRPFYKQYLEWIGVGYLLDPQKCHKEFPPTPTTEPPPTTAALPGAPAGTTATTLAPAAPSFPISKIDVCVGYKKGLIEADFGTSYRTKEKVLDRIWQRVPVTTELFIVTLLLALTVSIPIGMYTAYKADGRFDRFWQVFTSVTISLPPFVGALILVWLFGLKFKLWGLPVYFPVTGWTKLFDDPFRNLWDVGLPCIVLALVEIPAYSRLLRADMIQTLQEDYILAARAKGLPTKQILLRHALRPSSFSLLTLSGLSLGRIISGSVIVENIFALPGLGQLIVSEINNKDVLVVQGTVMFIAILVVIINALIDVLYTMLDPRVRTRSA